MPLTLLPDVEALVSQFLRGRSEVSDLCGQRVYTELPKEKTFPLVRLVRIGGVPPIDRPLRFDEARLQVDTWGGPKKTAHDLAETIRQVLVYLPDETLTDAVVTAVRFGSLAYLPDDDFAPAKPRYTFDAAVWAHPKP